MKEKQDRQPRDLPEFAAQEFERGATMESANPYDFRQSRDEVELGTNVRKIRKQ